MKGVDYFLVQKWAAKCSESILGTEEHATQSDAKIQVLTTGG